MTDDGDVRRLLMRVREAGVQLEARGDRLAWSAPTGVMTPEFAATLKAAKPRLLAALQGDPHGWMPLAPVQEHLYAAERLRPGRHDLNVPAAMWIDGEVDLPALNAALGDLVARHDALRLTFALRDDRPVQQVCSVSPAPLTLLEVGDEGEAIRAAVEEARRPFRLDRPPTLRAWAARTTRGRHLVVLTFHHLTCDEASLRLALRETTRRYAFLLGGRDAPGLQPPPKQYGDYVAETRDAGDDPAARTFWQGYLSGFTRTGSAMTPSIATSDRSPHPAWVSVPASAVTELRALAVAEHTTLVAVVFACYAVMLGRTLGRNDVVVGLPWEARPPEYALTMGTFVNTVPVRVPLPEGGSFRDVVRATRTSLLAALKHAHVPYRQVVDAAGVVGVRGDAWDGWLVMRRPERPTLDGLRGRRVELEPAVARHDLKLDLEAGPGGLAGMLLGRPPAWPAALVERSAACLTALLERAAAHSELPLAALQRQIDHDVAGRLDVLAKERTEHVRGELRSARRRTPSA